MSAVNVVVTSKFLTHSKFTQHQNTGLHSIMHQTIGLTD